MRTNDLPTRPGENWRRKRAFQVADLDQLYTAGDPGRDPRGWTVSVAYLAQMDPNEAKPVAADDAEAVGWFPLDELPRWRSIMR